MKKIYVALFILFSVHFFAQINLNSSLTACYALDGNANDPVSSLTGTLNGVVTPTVDRLNNPSSAYFFNGNVSSYIRLPNSPLLKANTISFSCWVKINSLSGPQFIAFVHNGCTGNQEGYQFAVAVLPAGPRFQIAKSSSGCLQVILNSTLAPVTQTWYHVGFYAGADSLKIYVNGALNTSMANTNPLAYSPSAYVYLGGSALATVNLPLSGSLDNVRFYNRKLNGDEFNQLFIFDPRCISNDVGIPEKGLGGYLSVYPNPGQGNFVVSNSSGYINTCVLYNALGEIVLKTNLEAGASAYLDISQKAPGVYFLSSENGGKIRVQKIIKTD